MKTNRTKIRPLLIFLIVISLALSTVSFTSCSNPVEYLEGPEEIRAMVEAEEDRDKTYVVDYLKTWNFLPVTKSKFKGIEIIFRDYYIHGKHLPKGYELAKETVNLFLDYCYTLVDLTDETETTDALIACYVEAVGDPYAVYRTAKEYEIYDNDMSGNYVGIGVTIQHNPKEGYCEITDVAEDSGAEEAGILPGDRIIGVNDVYISGESNYLEVIDSMSGEPGTNVIINLKRDQTDLRISVTRKILSEKSVKYSIIDGNIGYVRITGFKENTYAQFRTVIDELKGAKVKGVIYDLRGNLGGYLSTVVNMLSYIAPKGTELVSFSNDYSDPMKATGGQTFMIPSVVICNGRTASAAELFTAAIRDFNTMGILEGRIVGTTTFGKGVIQSPKPFTDGSVITLTIAYFYPPLGKEYCHDGVGITPDVVVELGEAEADTQYNAALETIKELIK